MKKLYLAAVAGNLGMVSIGLFFGWASPSLPALMSNEQSVNLNSEEASWVASLLTLGATVGSIVPALIVNTIGRKNTMLFTAVPSIIGWMMIAYATTSWELYISRFISGIASGIGYTATPMYLGEISPPGVRGILGSMLTVAAELGALIEYTMGPFLSMRNLALVSLVAPFLFVVSFIWLPESPYQLMRRGDRQKAIESLVQLRGKEDVCKEADNIERSVKADLANETGFREILFVPGNRRALMTTVGLVIVQQWSGSQAVAQYAQIILDQAKGNMEGKYLTMILGAVQVSCTIFCTFVTDRSGRKPLLTISAIGAACSTAMVGAYFYLQHVHVDISGLEWLPATGAIMYKIMYALGLAALPFTLVSELFPTNVKALGSTIVMTTCNFCAFVVTKTYPIIAEQFGIHVAFWIFSACSLAGAFFTLIYVPETKGKTLEEIQEKLHDLVKQ